MKLNQAKEEVVHRVSGPHFGRIIIIQLPEWRPSDPSLRKQAFPFFFGGSVPPFFRSFLLHLSSLGRPCCPVKIIYLGLSQTTERAKKILRTMGSHTSNFSTGNEIRHNHHKHGVLNPSTIRTLSAVKLCTVSPRSIQHVHNGFNKMSYFFNGRLPWARYYPN